MSDRMRDVLCSHFGLECPPVSGGRHRRKHPPSREDTFLIRADDELFQKIKRAAYEGGMTMKDVIMDALEAHYQEVRA